MTEFLTAPNPIRSVLVANRGEIACRIIRSCQRLGLRSIAVHSEPDANAPHVRLADRAICIGPAPSTESYLSIPRIIAAAREGSADAIHPGYGFLSENAGFVRAVEEAGLIFVGPSAEAVRRMGSKIEARRIADAAGVPTVPGFEGLGADGKPASMEELAEAAARIGYPIMVKANSGGGGRGMRRVLAPEGLETAIASARQEAGASFGDETVFLEKLVTAPRHLEVQVFGDGAGSALHFYERDCSAQRNHQKVIEEAPAPNLPEPVREALLNSALNLTRTMGYAGAGTVEYIMEAGGNEPWFLEMNTRLQVEHPVTEEICGVDLVALQLRQAAGLPLGIAQEQIVPRGHSIEVRLNAERPEAGFLPATGRLVRVAAPEGLRFETGVVTGSDVGSHYDSMLAKLIAHGPDRETARQRLIDGLERLEMLGVGTNQAFLADCLRAPTFARGEVTTAFLEETFPEGWSPSPAQLLRLRGAAALHIARSGGDDPRTRPDGFRVMRGRRPARAEMLVADDYGEVEIVLEMAPAPAVRQGEAREDLAADAEVAAACALSESGPAGGTVHVMLGGLTLAARVTPLAEARLGGTGAGASEGQIAAPLTGRITAIHVSEGQSVCAGSPLMEMEAMKLVHTLAAPFDGIVRKVTGAEGDTVQAKAILIEIEEAV